MAIFFPGMKCPLCRTPIERDQRRRLFPPFVRNSLDPFYVFHDATVHEECFVMDPRAEALENVLSKQSAVPVGLKVCAVCNGSIVTRERYTTDYITADPSDPLFNYNFLSFHRAHLLQWESWSEFQRLAATRQASDAWRGPAILPAVEPP